MCTRSSSELALLPPPVQPALTPLQGGIDRGRLFFLLNPSRAFAGSQERMLPLLKGSGPHAGSITSRRGADVEGDRSYPGLLHPDRQHSTETSCHPHLPLPRSGPVGAVTSVLPRHPVPYKQRCDGLISTGLRNGNVAGCAQPVGGVRV